MSFIVKLSINICVLSITIKCHFIMASDTIPLSHRTPGSSVNCLSSISADTFSIKLNRKISEIVSCTFSPTSKLLIMKTLIDRHYCIHVVDSIKGNVIWSYKSKGKLGTIGAISISQDDQYIAIGSGWAYNFFTPSEDGVVCVWRIKGDNAPVATWSFKSGDIHDIKFIPKSNLDRKNTLFSIAVSAGRAFGTREEIRSWLLLLESGVVRTVKYTNDAISPVSQIVVLKNGKSFFEISLLFENVHARIWDAETFKPSRTIFLGKFTPLVSFAQMSPDGSEFAICDPHKGDISFFDSNTGKLLRSASNLSFETVRYCSSGKRLGVLLLASKQKLIMWDSIASKTICVINAPSNASSVFISPSGHLVGWIVKDKVVIYRPRRGKK